MKIPRMLRTLIVLLGLCGYPCANAIAQERELVAMPPMMQQHLLRNMRDHLEAVSEILELLSQKHFDQAASVAEKRLGMSSLGDHGASHMATVMPEQMRAIGTAMHRAASRFALAAQDASVTESADDLLKLYGALNAVTRNCNACHRAYRVK